MNIFNIIKSLFCNHSYIFKRNIYEDKISEWKCSKCGKSIYKKDLHLNLDNILSLNNELHKLSNAFDMNNYNDWVKKNIKFLNDTIDNLKNAAYNGLHEYSDYYIFEDKDIQYFKRFMHYHHLKFNMKTDNTPQYYPAKTYYITISWS